MNEICFVRDGGRRAARWSTSRATGAGARSSLRRDAAASCPRRRRALWRSRDL